MKVIKKIAAIMFALVMVISMGANVSAVTNSGSQEDNNVGSITIRNPINGHDYKLYRILELASYSYEDDNKENGNYSYQLREGPWTKFINETAVPNGYVKVENGYVQKGANSTDADYAEFAKLAIQYAKTNNIEADYTSLNTSTEPVTITGMKLGFYAVDSSVGALCGLTTADSTVTIDEKNEEPTVTKEVKYHNGTYGASTNAAIGDTVNFKITITAKKGAENYVLHDEMDKGLTLTKETIKVLKNGTALATDNYDITYNDKLSADCSNCSFHISFTDTNLQENDQIIVEYEATLNKDAVIGHGQGNQNKAKLTYGDNKSTVKDETWTSTYSLPVFKYTKDGETENGLASAEFELTKDNQKVLFVKKATDGDYDVYRVATAEDTDKLDKIITSSTGKFKIEGLFGTYELKEIKAPKGYNKLTEAKKIEIGEGGSVKIDNQDSYNIGDVKVLNQSGTILPSTGGMGTTVFYIAGALLVLISGVVLIAKKRTDSK